MPWLGIYLPSALLIAGFMRWIGRYGWLLTLAISIGLPILIYLTFENGSWCRCPRARSRTGSGSRTGKNGDGSMEGIGDLMHGFAVVLSWTNFSTC